MGAWSEEGGASGACWTGSSSQLASVWHLTDVGLDTHGWAQPRKVQVRNWMSLSLGPFLFSLYIFQHTGDFCNHSLSINQSINHSVKQSISQHFILSRKDIKDTSSPSGLLLSLTDPQQQGWSDLLPSEEDWRLDLSEICSRHLCCIMEKGLKAGERGAVIKHTNADLYFASKASFVI